MKITRRTKLLIVALALCITTMVGSTLAWFTDTVESGVNTIEAGNLDIELYKGSVAEANKVSNTTKLFELKEPKLWEPGAVAAENLIIKNEGNLALKYEMVVNASNENTVNGKGLSAALQVGIIENGITAGASREQVLSQVTKWYDFNAFEARGDLLANTEKSYGVVIYWAPKANDNDWNVNNGKQTSDNQPLHIDLGVKLVATQLVSEEDSFGKEYDQDADYTSWEIDTDWYDADATEFVINTAEELAGLAKLVNEDTDDFAGKTIKLGKSINLANRPWTPIGRIGVTSTTDFTYAFKGTFDGQNYTISNLEVANEGWAGLFGIAHDAEFKDVKIENVSIRSNRMAGSLVGQLYGSIENCHVKDAKIMVVPNAVATGFDNGDKVGGIVGWLGDNGDNHNLIGCSATDVALSAYRDVGGIAGYVASSTNVKDNSAYNVDIVVDQQTNHYGEKDANAGYVCGRINGTINESNNTNDSECSKNATYLKDGIVYVDDDENVTLYLVPAGYTSDKVVVPEGVTAIGNYAFAYNSNVKTVTVASSVRDLGRGFDSSTVENVILKDGLQTISSRAFKATSALKNVTIPTTVTTIADDAFQKTSLKEIVIPATVKYVGATAFGASKIEAVHFEGNTEIQNMAFRGCANLRTVYMEGEDITFANTTGKANCWFCNSESNNPNVSNITFYVKNETVAQKVKTAMGAEANNTPVYVNGSPFSN